MLLPVLYIYKDYMVHKKRPVYYQFWISTPVRSLLILVYSCLSLLDLLIFGWLPHHCPFPELGPFTQTFLAYLSRHTVI